MKDVIRVRHRNNEKGKGMAGLPAIFMTLTITLIILTLGGRSAFGQCDGLCLYERNNAPQTKISAVDPRYQESDTAYLGTNETTGANRDRSVSDVQGGSNEKHSGMIAGDRISISNSFSDDVALNEMDWIAQSGENFGGSFYAADDPESNSGTHTSNPKNWELTLTSYAWLTSLNGDITIRRFTVDVDESFSDLFENLNIAAMFNGEVLYKGKFGVFVDTVYAYLSDDDNIGLEPLDIPLDLDLEVKFKLFILGFGVFYRVGTWDIGSQYNDFVQKAKPTVTLDLVAGGRYWHMKSEVDIHETFGILPSEIDRSKDWFDFIVGGRTRLTFYKKLIFEVRGDVGGFGLDFSSDISWNIVALIAYELPWYRITPVIGYRALYNDYSDGSGDNRFAYKAWLYGPVVGVAFRF